MIPFRCFVSTSVTGDLSEAGETGRAVIDCLRKRRPQAPSATCLRFPDHIFFGFFPGTPFCRSCWLDMILPGIGRVDGLRMAAIDAMQHTDRYSEPWYAKRWFFLPAEWTRLFVLSSAVCSRLPQTALPQSILASRPYDFDAVDLLILHWTFDPLLLDFLYNSVFCYLLTPPLSDYHGTESPMILPCPTIVSLDFFIIIAGATFTDYSFVLSLFLAFRGLG